MPGGSNPAPGAYGSESFVSANVAGRGFRYHDYNVINSGFMTILPPNRELLGKWSKASTPLTAPTSSHHAGGAGQLHHLP